MSEIQSEVKSWNKYAIWLHCSRSTIRVNQSNLTIIVWTFLHYLCFWMRLGDHSSLPAHTQIGYKLSFLVGLVPAVDQTDWSGSWSLKPIFCIYNQHMQYVWMYFFNVFQYPLRWTYKLSSLKWQCHHFNDCSDVICSENRWVCVSNWLLSTENSIAVKELNHNATSVLEIKQRRFVQSVSREGSSAAGKYPTQLMHSFYI